MACMFPKTIVFYPMTPRRILIMLIWGTMAIYHAHCTAALSRESRLGLPSFAAFGGVPLSRKVSHTVLLRRLLRHEVMKAKCVIANALAGMACILLLKRDEIGQVS